MIVMFSNTRSGEFEIIMTATRSSNHSTMKSIAFTQTNTASSVYIAFSSPIINADPATTTISIMSTAFPILHPKNRFAMLAKIDVPPVVPSLRKTKPTPAPTRSPAKTDASNVSCVNILLIFSIKNKQTEDAAMDIRV